MDVKTILGIVIALIIGVAFGNYYGSRNAVPTVSNQIATSSQTDLSTLTGQAYDKALIERLIAENDNFIQIAGGASTSASAPELKKLSSELVDERTQDNVKLESLLETLFGVKG